MMRFAALIVASFALVGSALAQQARLPGDSVRGEALARRWCAACHLLEGGRSATDNVPPFHAIANDPRKGPDFLRGFLALPHPPMPPLPLSRDEIENLIAYLDRLRGR